MYLGREALSDVAARLGQPAHGVARAEFEPVAFQLVSRSVSRGRRHDITVLIRDERNRIAVIRKPSYPPEVFRPPSGGVEPGETIEAGALREALEETGLEISLLLGRLLATR